MCVLMWVGICHGHEEVRGQLLGVSPLLSTCFWSRLPYFCCFICQTKLAYELPRDSPISCGNAGITEVPAFGGRFLGSPDFRCYYPLCQFPHPPFLKVLLYCLGWLWMQNHPVSVSQITGIIKVLSLYSDLLSMFPIYPFLKLLFSQQLYWTLWVCKYERDIPNLGRSSQPSTVAQTCNPSIWEVETEDQEFKARPDHVANLRPACGTWDIGFLGFCFVFLKSLHFH